MPQIKPQLHSLKLRTNFTFAQSKNINGQNPPTEKLSHPLHSNSYRKMSRHPLVKWAQRSDKLFITVDLPDAQNVKVKLEPEGKFFFSATAGADNATYEVDLDLYDKVDVNESKVSTTSRSICYLVKKAENKWWSRLLKQEGKPPLFLKADWDKWVDEDEQDEKPAAPDMDFGDFDLSKLSMLGGGEGADNADQDEGDDDDDDSDTEDEVKEEAAAAAAAAASSAPQTVPASSGAETNA